MLCHVIIVLHNSIVAFCAATTYEIIICSITTVLEIINTEKGQNKHRQKDRQTTVEFAHVYCGKWKTKMIMCYDIMNQYKWQTGLKYLLLWDEILCGTKGKEFTWALKSKKQLTTDKWISKWRTCETYTHKSNYRRKFGKIRKNQENIESSSDESC